MPDGVPVTPTGPVPVQGRIVTVGPLTVPGIGTGAAYAANDQFGSLLLIPVPKRGAIVKAVFHDLDDEGLGKELWLFNSPRITLAADNAAFSLADEDNLGLVDVLTFAVFKDAVNNQLGITADTPLWYAAPEGILWATVKTLGADNIAAGSLPALSFIIEVYD